jgi:prevent-host-death family protein
MQQVNIHAAKTNLSKLIEAAMDGEEIVIAKGGRPVVRLAPIRQGVFRIGLLTGQLGTAPDFLDPMEAAELDLWEGTP